MLRKTTLLALTGLLLAGTGLLPAQVLFTVTDLGTLGGDTSRATAVNNAGQVVGYSNTTVSGTDRAFIYSGGVLTAIDTLSGTINRATDINASGQVVGHSTLAGDTTNGGYLFSGGVVTPLNTLGGTNTFANAINDSGAIAGSSQRLSDNVTKPVVWANGTASPGALVLPTDTNPGSATGINNSGFVSGNGFYDASSPRAAPFRSTDGTTAPELPFFGDGSANNVTRINDAGAIAGTFTSSGNSGLAYIFPAGSTDYDPLFDFFGITTARDINNQNIVVGRQNLNSTPNQGYRFDVNLGEWVRLNEVSNLAAAGFTHLTEATGISDNGLIVGYGTTTGGETHAFLLTPTNVVKFWDGNGTTAGLGQVNGTWSLTAGNWTTNTTGTAAGNGWTNGSYARFLNGPDMAVSLQDNVSASGIFYISGNTGVTITGGLNLTLVNDALIKVGNTQKGIHLDVVVAGTAGLVKEGNGTLRLSGNNTYTGQTLHHGGDLYVAHGSALGATGAGNETIIEGGRIRFDTTLTTAESLIVRGDQFALTLESDYFDFVVRDVILSGPIKLEGSAGLGGGSMYYNSSLTVTGVISEDPSGERNLFVYGATLTGANTFTGRITTGDEGVTVNTINADGAPGPLGAGYGIVLGYQSEGPADGSLHYTGSTDTATRTIQLEGGYGTVDVVNEGTTLTLDGLISGTGNFAKNGVGAVHLLNPNSYTGGTTIHNGILRIANSTGSALGTGNVLVYAGGTLTGPGTFTGSLSINGHYAPGDSPALVSLSGSVTLDFGGYIDFEIGGLLRGTQYDALNIGGTFISAGGSLSLTLINGFSPALGDSFNLLDWNTDDGIFFTNLDLPGLPSGLYWETGLLASTGTIMVAAVPEPSTYALMFCGLLMLGLGWRRRRPGNL